MVDPVTSRRWLYRAVYLLLALAVLLLQILPVTQEVGSWPGPDIVLAVTIAWGMRRPDYLPALLVGAVCLMADLILQRPPGLRAALVVLAAELVRARNPLWRDLPFMAEWAVAAVVMAAVILIYWLVLAVLLVPQAAFGLYMIELVATALCYPLAAGASVWLFGVRRPAPGSVDALGQRL